MSEENPLKLVFDEPKQRVKPPHHFADLDPAGRKALALELGIPAFRANQVATHFFTHHNAQLLCSVSFPSRPSVPPPTAERSRESEMLPWPLELGRFPRFST